MLPIIGAIVSAVSSVAKSWLETRKVKAQGKIDIAKARVQTKVETIKMKSQMDLASMTDMRYGWKDEYLVILLSMPVIMCFIPAFTLGGVYVDLPAVAADGFEKLSQTPAWYKWAFTGIVAATFGLRTWMGFKK